MAAYVVMTFALRVISGWCNSDHLADGRYCFDGYRWSSVLSLGVELVAMLALVWGAMFIGYLPFTKLHLSNAAALALGAVACAASMFASPLLGGVSLALLPAAVLVWCSWVAVRPNKSLERSRDR